MIGEELIPGPGLDLNQIRTGSKMYLDRFWTGSGAVMSSEIICFCPSASAQNQNQTQDAEALPPECQPANQSSVCSRVTPSGLISGWD